MKMKSICLKKVIMSLKYLLALVVAKKDKRDIWLISERPTQARDNGYCFFKYMRCQYPKKEVYYLIDKKADDYNKIKQYGNVIQFDSWKHYLYYCKSKIHISAHVNGCCPNDAIGISRRTKRILNFKDVFIPHGVSYGISEFCLKKYTDINLYICSGKPEYENIIENYGYSEDEVAYTGFPRLDNWKDKKVDYKLIVLMPTWRAYIAQNSSVYFMDTQYFIHYQELLNDDELSDFLENNDIKLIFYLHNEMRKYVNYFKTNNKNIQIAYDDREYDIQNLLKTAALLITDYSSVHFDFAYMNKPVIYYQFDQKEFYQKQYENSFFSAERNGFGPVAYEKKEVVDEIKKSLKLNFQMEPQFYNKMREFYRIYDDKNCERVYQAIEERLS